MPFALHTCGVTTSCTDTTISIGHDRFTTTSPLTTRTPFKKGEGCAAAADDFARQAATPLEKALRRDVAPSGV